jgi:hypothetical protein
VSKTLTNTLGVLLIASVGLNVWQGSAAPDTAGDASGADGASTADPRGARGDDDGALEACRRELTLCQRKAKLGPLVLGTFGGKRRDRSDDDADSTEGRGARTAEDLAAEKHDYLCGLGREQVKRAWLERQTEIVWALRASLSDANVQENDMRAAVDRYAEGLDLDAADRDRFEAEYRQVRLDRIDKVRGAIEQDPPDYPEILDQLKALHADEDRITTELFGDEATIWLRENELDARASLRAIAATYAGVPWEEAVDMP